MFFFDHQIDYNRLQFILIFNRFDSYQNPFLSAFLVQIIYRFYTDFLQIIYTLYTDYIPYKIHCKFVSTFIEKNSNSKNFFVAGLVLLKTTKIEKKN